MLALISKGEEEIYWGSEGDVNIFSPTLLREEFSDVLVWDEERGELRNNEKTQQRAELTSHRSGIYIRQRGEEERV